MTRNATCLTIVASSLLVRHCLDRVGRRVRAIAPALPFIGVGLVALVAAIFLSGRIRRDDRADTRRNHRPVATAEAQQKQLPTEISEGTRCEPRQSQSTSGLIRVRCLRGQCHHCRNFSDLCRHAGVPLERNASTTSTMIGER